MVAAVCVKLIGFKVSYSTPAVAVNGPWIGGVNGSSVRLFKEYPPGPVLHLDRFCPHMPTLNTTSHHDFADPDVSAIFASTLRAPTLSSGNIKNHGILRC